MTRWLSVAAVSAATLFHAHAASASAVVIWPVDPKIKAGEQATTLWLENKGDAAVTMQVRTFAWSQASGEDSLDAQDAVVASPPIARVEPGQRQLVRLVRRKPSDAPESAYRLIVDELPPPPATGTEAPQARLAVQMRYSVPLFTYGTAEAGKPQLRTAIRVVGGEQEIVLTNTGTTHARLTDLRTAGGSNETVLRGGLVGYVLPGATVAFRVPAATSAVRVGVNGIDQTLAPSI